MSTVGLSENPAGADPEAGRSPLLAAYGRPERAPARDQTDRAPARDQTNRASESDQQEAVFDEVLDSTGQVRPHYAGLVAELDDLGEAELGRRSEAGRRISHEQGVAYNVYGEPRGSERAWELDPVPFLISSAEWTALEKALVQRATLLNRILADCYGSQQLLRSSWLPPALVFAQPDFLRPLHDVRVPRDTFLHFYAADLARSPDGQWWVTSDRTQVPTGAGYALANRMVTSRILPEAFRNCAVQRLAGFFREVQRTLAELAPRGNENPRVVLLTPGPYNDTYFEQTWLARYLGYSLVEGQDLTVRDDRVYLKTLGGLEPVDVILRRVDDDFCDPLELRNESVLGVPGLVEALRAGNVTVANALGSGLVQSPAFMGFLPGLCRHLLGEELALPSVATWWCGQKDAGEYVLEHLDEVVVKSTFRSSLPGSRIGGEMTPDEREALRQRILFQPHLFVGQERVPLATAPSWNGTSVQPRPVALRVYLVATQDGYAVMPGGLARVTPEVAGRLISTQIGSSSKDTWVISDAPVQARSLLQVARDEDIELRRVGNNLPSRLADNYYWLGRYGERSDATARLLRAALLRFSLESARDVGPLLSLIQPVLETLTAQDQLPGLRENPLLRDDPEGLEAELLATIFDAERKGSLMSLADQLQKLVILVRDRSSNDLWRVLRTLDDGLAPAAAAAGPMLAGDAVRVLNHVILGIAAFHGLARENMTRAQGWRFLDIGVRIERAMYLSTFLASALQSPEAENPSVLETVLEVADCTITYRSRYNLLPNIAAVYDLVMLDDTNPRSLFFQLNSILRHLEKLPRARESALPSAADRILIASLSRLQLLDPRPLARMAGAWHESETGQLLRDILIELPRFSDLIAVSYFAHSEISHAGWASRRSGAGESIVSQIASMARNEGRTPGTVL
ncbi:MAG TPA: circularly permuted type 2 ATP-grasp protein [Candidatus Limnocylindrales bacterium]|nr:circularly permuted type 2 ATP-grasp protein [Candidatus Limnocylindrales bacterium]